MSETQDAGVAKLLRETVKIRAIFGNFFMDSPQWDQNPAAIYIPKRDEDHPHLFYMGVPPNCWESCLLRAVGQT